LLIAYCQLLIANYLLPIASCLLLIANCLSPITYCQLPVAYCLLPIAYRQLLIAHRPLPIPATVFAGVQGGFILSYKAVLPLVVVCTGILLFRAEHPNQSVILEIELRSRHAIQGTAKNFNPLYS
jgi:hypothetical protein